MKQTTFASTGFELVTKRTRKREFLEEMNLVVPWTDLVSLIEPFAPMGNTGRPPFPLSTMLRIHFMQQWFGLSDPAMEEALHDMALCREFAQLDAGATRLPDESTILRFRHLLEAHNLAAQMLASVNGQLWNAESIGRSLGTSGNTVKTYLDFLESSFFVHVLRPYFANPGKRLVKSPKVYIRDTGILHALTGVSRPEDLPVFAQAGNSWEGYVIGQILQILPSGLHPYFYRTADGTECDLILVRGLEPVACIEIILGTVVNASRNFRACIADLGTRHNFIINYASEAYQLTENITVVGLLGFLRGNYLQ